MKNLKNLLWLLPLSLMLFSCSDAIFEEHKDVNSVLKWVKDDIKTFTPNIPDKQPYDVAIALRHHAAVQGPTMPLKYEITGPNDFYKEENVAFVVRDQDGVLVGSVAGDIVDTEMNVLSGFSFPEAGEYSFKVYQVEQGDAIPGIMEIGLVVTPVKKGE